MGTDADSKDAPLKSAVEHDAATHDGATRLASQEMEDFGVTAVDAQQMEHAILNRVCTAALQSALHLS